MERARAAGTAGAGPTEVHMPGGNEGTAGHSEAMRTFSNESWFGCFSLGSRIGSLSWAQNRWHGLDIDEVRLDGTSSKS